jgi:hypothetical protein
MAKKQKVTVTQIVPASELATIRSSYVDLVANAGHLAIKKATDEDTAYNILKTIAAKKKEIEKRRKEITKPLNASLKATNALFKEVTAPLVEADGILREKILAFQRIQQEKADKEMERREKIQASHEARGHETHEIAEVEPDVGVSTVTKRWTYKVINEKLIPRKYLIPHPVAIGKAIRNGEREIAGLEIYQEEGLRV